MGDKENHNVLFKQGVGDLPCNLRALPLVCRREQLIEQYHGACLELVDNHAHPAKLLVELPALHGCVLFPPEMSKKSVAEVGMERFCGNEHATLHHQLGHADATQKCRLATLVGTIDDDQVFFVGVDIIADDAAIQDQSQACIVKPRTRTMMIGAGLGLGKAQRPSFPSQPPMQIHTTDIEGQLGPLLYNRWSSSQAPSCSEGRDQRFEQMKRELALSAEQTAQLDVYRTTFHAELDSLSSQLVVVRTQLAQALSEERLDTARVNNILDGVNRLQSSAQRKVISHLLTIKSMLNAEQQEKFFTIVLERFASTSDHPMPGRPSH